LARLDEQGRFLAEREYDSDKLRGETATARKNEADLRAELAEAENRKRAAVEAVNAERVQIEAQFKQAQEERNRLQTELTAMKREVEVTWANERMENAVLRERINDVAAEVARLTSVLEGPGSAIDTILAGEPARAAAVPLAPAAADNGDKAPANGQNGKGSLADRIRALQHRASQVPQPSRA
jgi:hypothetical protein